MENNPESTESTIKHVFGCEVCSYETNRMTNLLRHLKSSKHLSTEHNLIYKKQTPEELLKECVSRIKELEEMIKQKDKEISKKDKRNVLLRDELADARHRYEFVDSEQRRLLIVIEEMKNERNSYNFYTNKKSEIVNEVITHYEY